MDATDFERFIEKVRIDPAPGACWEWQGNAPGGRYGHFSFGLRTVKAHRWLYEVVVGPIPDDLLLRHKCDNPRCVRPTHLEPGTHADNARDKVERGRMVDRQGEKHPLARLSETEVREIRRLSSLGFTQTALSQQFGVARGQIGKIVTRVNWRHI